MVPTQRSVLICRHTVAREFRLGPFRFATRQSDWSVEHRFESESEAESAALALAAPPGGSFRAACASTLPAGRSGGPSAGC